MLEIRDLSVTIGGHQVVSVEEIDLPQGTRLGLVGESGSGKTMTAMSIVGLQPREAAVTGSVRLGGRELLGMPDRDLAGVRGADVGVVFQDPLRALNPLMRVGRQVAEAIRLHERVGRTELRARVLDLLTRVHLQDAERLVRRYPHQLSGGQRQRVLIAVAIACRPKLLIADEPTTALDVTVQKGILDLLLELSDEHGMSLLFVSHDLGVVRAVSDRVAVMYGGHLVELGPVDAVIDHSHHRYTEALVAASPAPASPDDLEARLGQRLAVIEGSVPPLGGFPPGCRFRGRCPYETDACADDPPVTLAGDDHRYKCWHPATTGVDLDATTR